MAITTSIFIRWLTKITHRFNSSLNDAKIKNGINNKKYYVQIKKYGKRSKNELKGYLREKYFTLL